MKGLPKAILATLVAASLVFVTSPAVAATEHTKHRVQLSGELSGDGWEVADRAILVTSPKYKETYLEVKAFPVDATSNRTPMLTATLGRTKVTCETFRSYIWSSMDNGKPTQLTLKCDKYLSPGKAKKVKNATLS